MDKTALKHKILTLEGLTNEEKSALLELLNKQKKYGLVWEEKPEDVEERLRDSLPVFKEVKERSILSTSPDAPNHILIEGDNLEALTALSYTHEGKIDVIYIDPPYNTGNKDFIYNDSFVDSEDGYRHSKWLSFMSKRLRIAKRLLSDKGVIFISIDDNEQAQLKLLCDEVFGLNNFIANVIWEKKYTIANDAKYFSDNHDFIVSYAKNKPNFKIGQLPRTKEMNAAYKNPDNHPKGPWKATPLHARSGSEASAKFSYKFKNGVIFTPPKGRYSAYSSETLKILDEANEIWFGADGRSVPSRKTFLCDLKKSGVVPRTIIKFEQGGHNHEADEEIKSILGSKVFSSPKPSKLIKLLLNIANLPQQSIILDFFAGSGTTLHATMQLNSEDCGHRQCILVTNNENKICEEVTYERNKRVINGYTTPKGEQVEGLKNNTLRYYKTELLPREKSPRNMRALMAAATELLCIKEDLYEESKRFGRYRTNPKTIRYFEKGNKRMLIIFCEELADQIAEEIKTLDFGGDKLKIYIFSPDRYAFDDNFYEVQDKVTLVALPAAIYDAYRRVLPKRIDKPLLEVIAEERLTSPVQQTIDFESNNDNAQ